MFKNFATSELTLAKVLPLASFFKYRLSNNRSLSTLLWLIRNSQMAQSRLLWYQTCFFFASLPRISERSFIDLFSKDWRYSCLFFIKNQSFFFRALESYYSSIDFLQFSPDYFRRTYKPTTLLLPYVYFHLRAPTSYYLIMWYHSEQVRMRFFNDYVKSHDFLNRPVFLPRRFRLQRTVASYRTRPSRRQLLRYMFLLHSFSNRFHVVEMFGFPMRSFDYKPKVTAPVNLLLQSAVGQLPSLHLLANATKLPFRIPSTVKLDERFFFAFKYMQLNLWGNGLLADAVLMFPNMNRLDWPHYFICFPLYARLEGRLLIFFRCWTDRLMRSFSIKAFIELIFQSSYNFFTISSLMSSFLPISTSNKLYFTWWVLKFLINRFWYPEIFDRWARVNVFSSQRTRAKYCPINYQWYNYIRLLREFLPKFSIFRSFLLISPYFTKTIIPLDFLFWRISSNGGPYRDFLANGAFSLPVFFRKLTLDHYARERFMFFRFFLEKSLCSHGFYIGSGRTSKGIAKNPWRLKKPLRRLPDGVFDSREPRLSFKVYFSMAIFRKFVLNLFRRSPILSISAFFLFLDQQIFWKTKFVGLFFNLAAKALGYSRYYIFYKTAFKEFRRYPHQTFVHSRTDPAFRARWFSFADRMRRAGIKRSQLPYYPERDDMDSIADLHKRFSKASWNQKSPYWVIVKGK